MFDDCKDVAAVEAILKAKDDSCKIGVQNGTTGQFYVEGDADWGFDGFATECVGFKNGSLAVQDMLNGNVDFVVIDAAPASAIASAINEMPTGFAGLMIAALFSLSWCALCRQSSVIVSYFVNENATTGAEYGKRIFRTKALVLLLTYLLLFSIAFFPGVGQFVKTLISL